MKGVKAMMAGKKKKKQERSSDESSETSDSSSDDSDARRKKRKHKRKHKYDGSYAKRKRDDSDDDQDNAKRYACYTARVKMAKCAEGLYDSGASTTMTGNKKSFVSKMQRVRGVSVTIADGKVMKAKGQAEYAVTTRSGMKLTVGKALYVPRCRKTLISVSQMAKQPGCARIEFDRTGVYFVAKTGARTQIGTLVNGLYHV